MAEISIIVPVLDEAREIGGCLEALAAWRARGYEVIVVDGGSRDGTAALAAGGCDLLVHTTAGRARQMNAGAAAACGALLVFLHVDTRLPLGAEPRLAAIARCGDAVWGRFDVELTGGHAFFRVIAALMNRRSRWTGIATGDQAIFVTRQAFDAAGGYREIDLMEDIDLSARLRRRGRPICLTERVVTSARRWERHGVIRTILKMWGLRLAYFCGVSPGWLRSVYDPR